MCHFLNCPLPLALGRNLGHCVLSSHSKPMTTGQYLVACPALGEREIVSDPYTAADLCYSMHDESGSYAFVEDWLGWTYMEYGEETL